MTMLPKFKANNPQTREEKLIMELIRLLEDTTHAFIKLNFKDEITHQSFVFIRDAAIGYAGNMTANLFKLLIDEEQKNIFIKNAIDLYHAYINEVVK